MPSRQNPSLTTIQGTPKLAKSSPIVLRQGNLLPKSLALPQQQLGSPWHTLGRATGRSVEERAWPPLALDSTYVFPYARLMKTVSATEARKTLYRLLDEVAVTSEPVQITGRRSSGVLLSESDWRAIEETLHLLSIPGMGESIREGLETPLEECVEELDW